MVVDTLSSLYKRLRPREGWLSLLLLLLVIVVLINSVLEIDWVAEDNIVLPAALLGLLMAAVLAKRPIPSWFAWLLISLYGLLIVLLTLARLWPPPNLLIYDWPALRLYWLENGSLFVERAAAWLTAVSAGGRSNETIVFALLLGLGSWFLAAYLGWSAYRGRRPLLGLTLMGLLIALNSYYGAGSIEWVIAYVGVAVLATAVFHFALLESDWEKSVVDYSSQIRIELILYAAGIGAALLALSFLIPAVRINPVIAFFFGSDRVAALEESLDRAFGGVDVPRGRPIAPGMPGGSGVLPRAFLVGSPPNLQQIVMMTAEAEMISGPAGASVRDARHWRALNYDVYTGRGWALSEETEKPVLANVPITQEDLNAQMLVAQRVHWRYDNRSIRYALGRPTSADHVTRTYWREGDDLVRIRAADLDAADLNVYELLSQLPLPSPELLRTAELIDIDRAIARRYTQLPAAVPLRVHQLAEEVAGAEPTPYDQALALETFLRQYDYSLDVPLPPAEVDVADYFLFDLQRGYCDYYATAMVVMARTLGLPARLASGFLAQPPDEQGVQTMRQINSHAWPEIYFAGFGWVEFEPTSAFVSAADARSPEDSAFQIPAASVEPPPIPEQQSQPPRPKWPSILAWSALVLLLGLIAWRLRQNQIRYTNDPLLAAYGRLQDQAHSLGQPLPPGQTPYEFNAALQARLRSDAVRDRLPAQTAEVSAAAAELTDLFVLHQYSANPPDAGDRARRLWRSLRRPLWRLRLSNLLSRRRTPS